MSETVEIVEQIPDAVVEDALEAAVIVKNNPYVLVGIALLAGTLGALGGYKLSQKQLRLHYKEIADKEIAEARDYYGRVHLKETPEKLLEARGENIDQIQADAIAARKRYLGEVETPAETEEELMSDEEKALYAKHNTPVHKDSDEAPPPTQKRKYNAFGNRSPKTDDDFDFAAEEANRTGERPYVITHDEFYENEKDYDQAHIVYYMGDDVLVDERDQPIPDEDMAVGDDNLTRFGYGSKDNNIVYIRNENLELDFEITRTEGSYTDMVLGLNDDDDERSMKHSHGQNGVRRFRTRE